MAAARERAKSTRNDLVPRAVSLLEHAEGRVASSTVPRGEQAVEALLREPVPLAFACEVLAELGGSARFDTADGLLAERVAVSDRARRWIWDRLARMHLAFEFRRIGESPLYVSLCRESAEDVARAVLGISLPASPPPATEVSPTRAAGSDTRLRDAIALVGALVHHPVRFTRAAGPHRGSLKKLTARLGIDTEAAATTIDRAAQLEILGARGDSYAPFAQVLRERHAQLVPSGELDPVVARLDTRAWTSMTVPFRILRRHRYDRGFAGRVPPSSLPQPIAIRQALEADVRLEWLEANGERFVRRRTEETRDASTGDGHVTPNFEVMLGPAATVDVTVPIALGAECVRIDRVVTFRLTPASVTGAVRSGLAVDELLAALGRVARTPVPSNVEHMVREWGAASVPATIRTVWCIEVPVNSVPALRERLGAAVISVPMPGTMLVDRRVGPEVLHAALDAAGVVRGDIVPLRDDYGDLYDEEWEHPSSDDAERLIERMWEPPFDYAKPPHAELFSRVRAFDAAALAAFEATYGAAPKVPSVVAKPDPLGEALAAVHRTVLAEANAFASRLRGTHRREAEMSLQDPVAWFPWSLYAAADREECALAAESLPVLLANACARIDEATITSEGWRVVTAASAHHGEERLRLHTSPRLAGAFEDLVRRLHQEALGPRPLPKPKRVPAHPAEGALAADAVRNPSQFAEVFEDAKRRGKRVAIYRHHQPDEAFVLEPERVDRTGGDTRLLGYDVQANRGRSFPIGGIERIVVV